MYDLIIIGAGIVGCSIAREISRYQVKILLLEKEADVACGTSKSNSAIIHAGYDAKPGSLKARLNVAGNLLYEQLSRELDIPFKRNGSTVVAFSPEELPALEELYQRGLKNGVPGMRIIDQNELRRLEPNIAPEALAAMYAETGGIICPFSATIAVAENAYQNGAEFLFNAEVSEVKVNANGNCFLKTEQGIFESKFVVNAAGVFADELNHMAGGEPFKITPRKGEYCLLDKEVGDLAKTVVFQVPTKMGKGILVTPTVHGNLLIGPNADDLEDKEDTGTSADGLKQVMDGALKAFPGIQFSKIITAFAGLRAVPDGEDFIIGPASGCKKWINAAGIESPGFTSAPAIAQLVCNLLQSEGLPLKENRKFNPYREPLFTFSELSLKEQQKLIAKKPEYGRVICRCETITEGEILDAIRRPLGARNVDGVKRRVRAGAGRCQGGFCLPRVAAVLARECNYPLNQVTKFGRQSCILDGPTKDPEAVEGGKSNGKL